MSRRSNLVKAKKVKNDEFYTQLVDIEKEMKHYKDHFKGKVIYCNCDDPKVSNFFKYFSDNFEHLGLKKLITTCYRNKNMDIFTVKIDGREIEDNSRAISLEYQGDKNDNRVPDIEEIGVIELVGDGDFRSEESITLLKEADIVITNPPFSLFREYIAQLIEYDKKFIILGNTNAIKNKDMFKLIKENKIWIGNKSVSADILFDVPNDIARSWLSDEKQREGSVYKIIDGIVKGRAQTNWFTNLDFEKRHDDLILDKKYSPEEYPKYDNYNAINVNKTKDIPNDYNGVMGVPITFMDKFNPNQFEIVGLTDGRDDFEEKPSRRYTNAKQINKNGTIVNGSKINTCAAIYCSIKPDGVCYTADNANGYLSVVYTRILIRNKKLDSI